MLRKLKVLLVLGLLALSFFEGLVISPVRAQSTPPPASPVVDLCGGYYDSSGAVTQKPGDWDRCRVCIYNNTQRNASPVSGKSWTPLGCVDTNAGGFVQVILRFVISLAGGLGFIAFLWGGFQLITASGDPGKIAGGKNTIYGAMGAIILLVFAVFLLQFIGISILGLPGFGG